MKGIWFLFAFSCLSLITIGAETAEIAPLSVSDIQAYYAKAYSGQLTIDDVLILTQVVNQQSYQKHVITILGRAAHASNNQDIHSMISRILLNVLSTLSPQVRKDAASFLSNMDIYNDPSCLDIIAQSLATSVPGVDLDSLRNIFMLQHKKGALLSEHGSQTLARIAVDTKINKAVTSTALEMLIATNTLTLDVIRSYDGPMSLYYLQATKAMPSEERNVFVVQQIVAGRMNSSKQDDLAAKIIRNGPILPLAAIRALIAFLLNDTQQWSYRKIALPILVREVERNSPWASVILVALSAVAHKSAKTISTLIEKALSWSSPVLKSQNTMCQVFDNLCKVIFEKTTNQTAKNRLLKLLIKIVEYTNITPDLSVQEKCLEIIRSQRTVAPKPLAGTGATA